MRNKILLVMLLLGSCKGSNTDVLPPCLDEAAKNIKYITFKDLKKTTELDGTTIALKGVFSYNFEDVALYSGKHNFNKRGIWLSFNRNFYEPDSLLRKLNGQNVIVAGRVNFSYKGHLGSYLGTVNVSCIKKLE